MNILNPKNKEGVKDVAIEPALFEKWGKERPQAELEDSPASVLSEAESLVMESLSLSSVDNDSEDSMIEEVVETIEAVDESTYHPNISDFRLFDEVNFHFRANTPPPEFIK